MVIKIVTLVVLLVNVIVQLGICINSFMKVNNEHQKERPQKYAAILYRQK